MIIFSDKIYNFTSFSFKSSSFDCDIEIFRGVKALNLVFFLRLLNISFAKAISLIKSFKNPLNLSRKNLFFFLDSIDI